MSDTKTNNLFTSDNQPPNRGRKKGSRNRATLLKKWLKVKTEVEDPATGAIVSGTVEDAVILALISEAKGGSVKAIETILDSVYGRMVENQKLDINFSELSDEELERLASGESL